MISGTATDANGVTATASVTLNIDKTKPALSISSLVDGASFSSADIVVAGSASDSLSGLTSVACNGVEGSFSSGSYSCSISLTLGTNLLAIRATDVAGNVGGLNFHVTLSGTAAAPQGLQVTPQNVNIAVGGTRTFSVVDELGTPRADATWAVSDSTIATITSDSSPTLNALAVGQVTLTATVQGITAQTQVNILADMPAGTVLWSAPAAPSFATRQIVQAVPASNTPDIFTHEMDSNANSLIRAFNTDGVQMWQTSVGQIDFPGLSPDGFGGVLAVNNGALSGTFVSSVTDYDALTGTPLWTYSGANPGYFQEQAIGSDGTVLLVQTTHPDINYYPSLIGLDPATGSRLINISLPNLENRITDCNGTVSTQWLGAQSLSNLAVDTDGTISVALTLRNDVTDCTNSTATQTVDLFQLKPIGTTVTTLIHTVSGATTDGSWVSQVIPDGQGGTLVAWGDGDGSGGRLDHVAHVSSSGSTTDYYFPVLNGVTLRMVLGENNVAYITDTVTIQAFDVNSGQPLWTYQAPDPNNDGVSFVASSAGGGLVINLFSGSSGHDTVVRFDSSGVPVANTWSGSNLDYWAGNLWLDTSAGAATGYSAAPVEFSTSIWPSAAMFGTNQAIQKFNVTNFSNGPDQHQTTIAAALQTIQSTLPSYNSCNSWLQGTGVFANYSGLQQVQGVLANNLFGHGTVNRGNSPAYDNIAFSGSLNWDKTPVPGLPTTTPPVVTVNDIGAFFNPTDNKGLKFAVGTQGYPGNTLRAQLAAMLHETAHQIEVAGFQHDTGIPKAGKANDALVNANCRELIEGPSIKTVSPSSGSVGTTVTITGAGFGAPQGSSTITFNGIAASATTWIDNQIVLTVPPNATTGNMVITIGGSGGQSASKHFIVQ